MRRLTVLLLLVPLAAAAPLPFRQAIELALRNSPAAGIAIATEMQAEKSYQQQRNLYFPQMVVGSGLGYSFGFPLSLEGSAPSLVNLNSQQLLLNLPQRDFTRAAQRQWTAATLQKEKSRADIIHETAVSYAELDRLTTALSLARQQEQVAGRIEAIARERFAAGVDTQLDVTRAQLGAARLRLRLAALEGAAMDLRLRLAQLTGLPADSIETVTESIPEIAPPAPDAAATARAVAGSPAVKVAEEEAAAKELTARGQGKWMYPAMDLVGQYALLSRHNNYDDYYRKFQRHNSTLGVSIRLPFLNFSARSAAEAAAAEAKRARHEASVVKDQAALQIQRLQNEVRRLAAARDVAQLEHQIARADAETARTRAEAGQINIREQETARMAESDRYAALLDAEFELRKEQMLLLRSLGELESWALGAN